LTTTDEAECCGRNQQLFTGRSHYGCAVKHSSLFLSNTAIKVTVAAILQNIDLSKIDPDLTKALQAVPVASLKRSNPVQEGLQIKNSCVFTTQVGIYGID
jgi:hypothetical protein